MPVGSCQLPPPLTHSPRLVTQASRHSALGGTLSEEMGAFGCLALELREAAPRVRARNHRSNWPCQAGQPEPPKAGLLHSRCPPLRLNITMSCVHACVCGGQCCREALLHHLPGFRACRGPYGWCVSPAQKGLMALAPLSSHSPKRCPLLLGH